LATLAAIFGTAPTAAVPAGPKLERRRPVVAAPANLQVRLALQAAAGRDLRPVLTLRQRAQLERVIAEARAERTAAMTTAWETLIEDVIRSGRRVDPSELALQVLRESILEKSADKKHHLQRLRTRNQQADAVAAMLSEIADASRNLAEKEAAEVALPDPRRTVLTATATRIVLQPKRRVSRPDLDAAVAFWEQKLGEVGDDAELANIDLQNLLQNQQQVLAMLSNISKVLHDAAMAVIRKTR
jgi:hypothetical protein